MAWLPFYLVAPSEDAARAAARAADQGLLYTDENGVERWSSYSDGFTVAFDPDVIVWKVPPTYDEDGELLDPGEREEGWFANLNVRDDNLTEAQAIITAAGAFGVEVRTDVVTPERVWA